VPTDANRNDDRAHLDERSPAARSSTADDDWLAALDSQTDQDTHDGAPSGDVGSAGVGTDAGAGGRTTDRDAHSDGRTADDLDARLRAVECALYDVDPGTPTPTERTGVLDDRLTAVERRLDDLDAAVQALQGYVGDLDHVNESVERRANAALAAAERPRPVHPVPDLPDPTPAETERVEPSGLLDRLFDR